MRIRLIPIVVSGVALFAAQASAQDAASIREAIRRMLPTAYQGRSRGPEQTEHFSRKVKMGRDGRVSIANIAGDIVVTGVTGGSGDEVSIEATKRTRGDKSEFGNVQITVDEHAGRVDVRTEHTGHLDHVSVDYIVTVPASASVDLHSVSGSLRISGVQGAARLETVSGTVTASSTPRIEVAKSVSGNVDVSGSSSDGDLAASSVSGNVHIKGVKARSIRLGAVSGDIGVSDAACDRVDMKSLSGSVEYAGMLAKGGRYDLTSHSGAVRMILSGVLGFELDASTFSGSINSELPLTIGGDPGANGANAANGRRRGVSSRSMHATFGNGSAVLTLRTFSGSIVITKR
jgi:Putative adhesin